MSSAPAESAGAASAISETGAEFGGALGIALLGSIGTIVYRASMAAAFPADMAQAAGRAARDTLGGALSAAEGLPAAAARTLVAAARDAFTQGLRISTGVGAAVAETIAVVVAVKLRGIARPGEAEELPEEEPVPELCLSC